MEQKLDKPKSAEALINVAHKNGWEIEYNDPKNIVLAKTVKYFGTIVDVKMRVSTEDFTIMPLFYVFVYEVELSSHEDKLYADQNENVNIITGAWKLTLTPPKGADPAKYIEIEAKDIQSLTQQLEALFQIDERLVEKIKVAVKRKVEWNVLDIFTLLFR